MNFLHLLTLSLFSIVILADTSCGPKFKGKCTCGYTTYDDRRQYVVNCTDQGFTNTTVLEYLPLETQVLIFTGNNIQELPWNVFGAIDNLTELSIVDMSNNHIHEIRGKSFHHVINVRRLILNHNNLSISSDDDEINFHHPRVFSNFINLQELHLTNAFADNTSSELSEDLHDIFVNSNLTQLRKLHLEQNEISKFRDRKVFCDLPHLMDLHLGDNLLKDINFDVKCLKRLRFIDLERNKFEYLKQRDLQALDDLQNSRKNLNLTIDLMDNPFTCDCPIQTFKSWVGKTNVTVRNLENYVCIRKTRRNYVLDLSLTRCKVNSHKNAATVTHTAALVFLLVVLSFVLVALLGALIYISKDRIKTVLNPALTQVSKKVQYTSIKDDDAPEQYV
ncbi:SLIT and NTRK-like protein 4 [Culicoides brevitarsis]|uniref:SLIT and NTRK-like protein 4 n=1 Tax=Culicoides brevitarsis TaxID=469753 RepID=UPI00307CA7CB